MLYLETAKKSNVQNYNRTYLRSKTKHYTVKVKKIYYYDPKKPSPIPCLPSTVELPPEIHDSFTDPIKDGQGQSQGKHMSFLPSRAFSIEVENLSFRKVKTFLQYFKSFNSILRKIWRHQINVWEQENFNKFSMSSAVYETYQILSNENSY